MHSCQFVTNSVEETQLLGEKIGRTLKGGEVFELVSDLGGGKTTFVGGLAKGFGSNDPVASPSFTISYVYERSDHKRMHHFDFYRLDEPGIVAAELAEVENSSETVVAVEWGEIVHDVLLASRVIVTLTAQNETQRNVRFQFPEQLNYLFEGLGHDILSNSDR